MTIVPTLPFSGKQLHDALKKLEPTVSDRAPLPSDDETQGYAVGSRWQFSGQQWVFDGARWIGNPVINAQAFGDLSAPDARAAIEAAMAFAAASNPLGGVVELPAGVINVGWSGQTIGGRRVGIQPRSNVTLRGQGSATVLRVADGANIDLIANDRFPGGGEVVLENFYVEDLVVDGNAPNQNPANVEGWNIRLWGFKDCGIRNVRSIDPNAWGIRIEYGDGLILRDIVTRHGPATNADGIHLVDVDNVVGGGLDVWSEGDDAFIVEATNKALIQNYAIAGLIAKATIPTGAGGRGCMLLVDENVRPDLRRGMRNVAISGLVTTKCRGPGIVLIGGDFEGVNIQGVADECGTGLALTPGNPSQPGIIRGCSFDVDVSRSTGQSLWAVTNYGTITGNYLRAGVQATAENTVPVSLAGEKWSGEIVVDYQGTTGRPTYAVSLLTTDSSLSVMADGCLGGLTVQGTAANNEIRPKRLKANGGNALNIAGGAAGNVFSGGKIIGPIVNGAAAKFFGVGGAENYGVASLTTDATGLVTVPHGLSGIPAAVVLTPHSASVGTLRITGRTATDFTVKAVSPAGADVASTAIVFSWRAVL